MLSSIPEPAVILSILKMSWMAGRTLGKASSYVENTAFPPLSLCPPCFILVSHGDFFSFLDEVLCIPDCTENNPELLILCLQLGLQTCAIISCLFNAEIKFRHLYDDRPQGKTDRGRWDPRYTRSLSTNLLLQKCLRSEGNILSI